ncbi:MAG: glycogen/starch synthase, partial [Verrucomicrobia bacterium]|nr:glycogen/starch synthase [Verrucomicrobiota bacterium]
MHIIHITSEMALIAKVGGLGDVILGLARQCQEDGHTVEVILPKYASIQYSLIRDLHVLHRDLWVFGSGKWQHNSVWSGWVEGIRVYFIEPHTAPHYFNREKIYGYPDDIER